jgi:ubiquinone biosynthesis protein COQ4
MSLLAVARSQRSLPLTVLAAPILRRHSPRLTRSIKSEPAYPGHIPLSSFENAFLAVGSAFMSLADPRRAGKWHYSLFYTMNFN